MVQESLIQAERPVDFGTSGWCQVICFFETKPFWERLDQFPDYFVFCKGLKQKVFAGSHFSSVQSSLSDQKEIGRCVQSWPRFPKIQPMILDCRSEIKPSKPGYLPKVFCLFSCGSWLLGEHCWIFIKRLRPCVMLSCRRSREQFRSYGLWATKIQVYQVWAESSNGFESMLPTKRKCCFCFSSLFGLEHIHQIQRSWGMPSLDQLNVFWHWRWVKT